MSTTTLTADEVRSRVAAIYEMQGDAEAAHGEEDKLRRDVLAHIASLGSRDVDGHVCELARLALETEGFDFARWCA